MRLITITLSVDSLEELNVRLKKFYRFAKCLFLLYNLINISKFVIEAIVDTKLSFDKEQVGIVLVLAIIAYLSQVIDILMLVYFVWVTNKFINLIFDNLSLTKFKQWLLFVILTLMCVSILMSALEQIISYTYLVLVTSNSITFYDCSEISLKNRFWFLDLLHVFFYAEYFTCFWLGFYMIAIFYSFTFEYEYMFN